MAVTDDIRNLQTQMLTLSGDFRQAVSALSALHASNESDIEDLSERVEKTLTDLGAKVEKLSEKVNTLTAQMMVMEVEQKHAAKDINDITSSHKTHRQSPVPAPPRTPTPPPPAPAAGSDWASVAKQLVTAWSPHAAALIALIVALLSHCGVKVEIPSAQPRPAVVVPAHVEPPVVRDQQTNGAPP